MTYRVNQEGDVCVLHIAGELDANSVPEIRGTVDALAAAGHARMIVDLSELRLIDSSGVGAIVSLYKRVRARGGTVFARGLRDQPLAIFRLLKLERIFAADEAAVAA